VRACSWQGPRCRYSTGACLSTAQPEFATFVYLWRGTNWFLVTGGEQTQIDGCFIPGAA